jgi:hypothetical protein
MMTPLCRVSLVFARDAPIAVAIRRGPSRMVEVVKWQTDTDQFEHGQWFYGRIYAERCGLSPSGSLFVYFAMKYGRIDTEKGYEQTFTAVSRPPYLTALAMWPQGDTWGGGGRFIDDQTLRLVYGADGTSHPGVANTQIYMAPFPKAHPQHQPRGLRIETNLDHYAPDAGFLDHVSSDGAWIGVDHSGRRIIVRDGRILVVDPRGAETLLKDFNTDTQRRVISPQWARNW